MPDKSSPGKPTFYAQEQPNTCAVACLRMVLSAYGLDFSEAELADKACTNEFGTDLHDLVAAIESLGFHCQAGVVDLPVLQQARFPIVYLDGPTLKRAFLMHAVVVDVIGDSIKVLDPSSGEVELDRALFLDAWEIAGSLAVIVRP